MSNGEVARVHLNADDTISLEVSVHGFDEGTPIEISGQAIQANGAIASFYSVQEMPAHDEEEGATLTLRSIPPIPPNRFDAGFPITVVTRVAQTGITILSANTQSAGSVSAAPGSGLLHDAWEPDSYSLALPQKRPPGATSDNGPVD
jgi:hypothetical protein